MSLKLRFTIIFWYLVVMLGLSSCVDYRPLTSSSQSAKLLQNNNVKVDLSNVCSIFRAKPHWYYSAYQARQKWNVPIHVAMAFVKQESGFKYDAVPKRKLANKEVVASSAYGYSQALKGTWKEYQKHTNSAEAKRDSFSDALDFIGWYNHKSSRLLKIKKWQTYHLYLAYHEGITGYKQKTYDKKKWLKQVAKKVEAYSYRYYHQLDECESEIKQKLQYVQTNSDKQPSKNSQTKQLVVLQNNQQGNKQIVPERVESESVGFQGCGTIFFFWTTPCIK